MAEILREETHDLRTPDEIDAKSQGAQQRRDELFDVGCEVFVVAGGAQAVDENPALPRQGFEFAAACVAFVLAYVERFGFR